MTGRLLPLAGAALAAVLLALPAQGVDRPPIRIVAVSLSGAATVLTNRSGVDTAPAVSPTTGEIAFASDRGGGFDLYVMTARGTNARRLTTGPFPLPSADDPSEVATNDVGTTSIAWSPNGRRLAFDAQNATFPPTCMHNCVDWRVFVMNADGSDLHQVADQARSPRWSSDGLRLAVVGTVSPYGDSESVDIVPLTSAPVVRIPAFSPFSFQAPSWSPRGVVAFQGFRGDNPPLLVQTADAAGAHRRVLGAGAQPVWSPDGMRLAFVRSGRLMVMDANGKGLRRLSSPGVFASFPAWSTNGGRIAFLERPAKPPGSPTQLAVVVVRTGVERRLTAGPRGSLFDLGPVWSRDGARILVPVSAGG